MSTLKYYASIAIIILISACSTSQDIRYETKHSKTVKNGLTVQSTSITEPDRNLFVESAGNVKFNEDGTRVAALSQDGYLIYKENGRSLFAENVGGIIESAVVVDGSDNVSLEQRTEVTRNAFRALRYTDSLRNSVSRVK